MSNKNFWLGIKNITIVAKIIDHKRKEKLKKRKKIVKTDELLHVDFSLKKNLEIFISKIQREHIKIFIGKIFMEMYKFEFIKYSSVETRIQKSYTSETDLDALSKINLLEHTIGALNELIKINGRSYGQFQDFYFLGVLTHDYGKCYSLRQKYALDASSGHHKASASYLETVFKKSDIEFEDFDYKMVENVISAVRVHHDVVSTKDSDTKSGNGVSIVSNEMVLKILNFIKEADVSQRKKELIKLGIRK